MLCRFRTSRLVIIAELAGDRAVQAITRHLPVQVKLFQVGQLRQLSRDRAAEAVAAQVEDGEVFELGQLRRNGAGNPVAAQVQHRQVGELTDFRRQLLAQQPVVFQFQLA